MKGLITKDLLLLKQQGRIMIMLMGCGLIMSISMESTAALAYLAVLGAMLSVGTLSYDEFDNGYPCLFALPVTRKMYVREKYLFSLSCCVVSVLVGLLIGLLGGYIKGGDAVLSLAEVPETVIGSMFAAVFMLAATIPARLKYGNEKGSIVLFAVFGILIAGYLVLGKYRDVLPVDLFRKIVSAVERADGRVVGLAIVAFVAVLFLLSEQLSERIMVHKEF